MKASEAAVPAGMLAEGVYVSILPSWRLQARRAVKAQLDREMPALVKLQNALRGPIADVWFVQSSLLGTHTFFMVFLPLIYWFGESHRIARGVVTILALGVMTSGLLKDTFCVPRPYSPPLVRLAVGNHALEYGFPSSHSTNSMSVSLFLGVEYFRYSQGALDFVSLLVYGALATYTVTMVLGRLVCGMHSFSDVVVGSALGALCWWSYDLAQSFLDGYVLTSVAFVTLTCAPVVLFVCFTHAEPVDDCPCYEDTVSFLGVVLGILQGEAWFLVQHHPAPAPALLDIHQLVPAVLLYAASVAVRMVLGIGLIIVWRIVAKSVIFNALNYTVASGSLVKRSRAESRADLKLLDREPIPSLHRNEGSDSSVENSPAVSSSSNGSSPVISSSVTNGSVGGKVGNSKPRSKSSHKKAYIALRPPGKHSARVIITKIWVYAGIGFIAAGAIPVLFEVLGIASQLGLQES